MYDYWIYEADENTVHHQAISFKDPAKFFRSTERNFFRTSDIIPGLVTVTATNHEAITVDVKSEEQAIILMTAMIGMKEAATED